MTVPKDPKIVLALFTHMVNCLLQLVFLVIYCKRLWESCSPAESLGNWIAGPNQGMYEAAREGYMPKFFAKTTKHDVPIRIMIFQSSIVTISALLITFTSGANADFAFNVSLAVTTAQYLMVYMIMLIAYIVLKKRHEDYHRMYYMSKNPNTSIAIAILALIITVIAFFVTFVPA